MRPIRRLGLTMVLVSGCATGGDRPLETFGGPPRPSAETDSSTGEIEGTETGEAAGAADEGSTTGGSDEDSSGDQLACAPGEVIECGCPTGEAGEQECLSDGSGFEPCACPEDVEPELECTDPAAPCGDCRGCAMLDACGLPAQACFADGECWDTVECADACGDDVGCLHACAEGVTDTEWRDLWICLQAACPQCA